MSEGNGDGEGYYDEYVSVPVFREYKEHMILMQDQCRSNIGDQITGLKLYFDKCFESAQNDREQIVEVNKLQNENMIKSFKLVATAFSIIAAIATIANICIHYFWM